MTNKEATEHAVAMNKHDNMYAYVVRILPMDVDPPKPNDNGWDVAITYCYA